MKLACRDVFCHHYNCVSLNAHIASLARAPSMQPHQTVFVLFFLSFSAFLSYLNSSIICFYWMTENMSIHNEKHYIRVLFHCISCYFKEEENAKKRQVYSLFVCQLLCSWKNRFSVWLFHFCTCVTGSESNSIRELKKMRRSLYWWALFCLLRYPKLKKKNLIQQIMIIWSVSQCISEFRYFLHTCSYSAWFLHPKSNQISLKSSSRQMWEVSCVTEVNQYNRFRTTSMWSDLPHQHSQQICGEVLQELWGKGYLAPPTEVVLLT